MSNGIFYSIVIRRQKNNLSPYDIFIVDYRSLYKCEIYIQNNNIIDCSNTSLYRIHLNKSIQMEVFLMKSLNIEERAIEIAQYIIDTKDTVRGAAKKFGISKSTVHKDVSQRLLNINYSLAMEVRKVLDENKAERHIRGGMATKLKYSHQEEEKRKVF